MISRTWHGMVPKEHADGFEGYLQRTGIKEAKEIAGNLGAYCIKIDQDDYAHFFLCTVWSSWADILRYAGNNPGIAIAYPEDKQYGLISDPIVIHQEVSSSDNPFRAYA